MKARICLLFVFVLLLSGCCADRCSFCNYCQKDYWRDNRWDIWGRKNCVGCVGRWIDLDNGRDGYWCTSPKCITWDRVRCATTCEGF